MATLRQLQETLSQTSGAQFLYQPVIDRVLFEQVRKFTSTRVLFPRRTWNTPVYEFNKRTNYPQARAVVEAPASPGNSGAPASTSSTYSQVTYPVKHWQTNMDLAKFSIQTARVNGDLMELELSGAAENAAYFEEAINFYGCAGGTANTLRPEWDGVDLLMSSANKTVVNNTPSFAMLDALIDSVKNRLGDRVTARNYAFALTPEMLSSIGRLFVTDQRWLGKATVYPRDDRGQLKGIISDNVNCIDGGVEVQTYRSVPLYESSFIASLGTMSTVTVGAPTGTDGIITPGTYHYVVEVVTDLGVSLACAEGTAVVGATNHVPLSWATPTITDQDGNVRQNLLFRIHRTITNGAVGSETLYAVLAAFDTTDTAVTSFNDTGAILTGIGAGNGTVIAQTVSSSGSQAIPDGVTIPRTNPNGHNQQDIWLLPRDPDILCVPVVNEMQTVPLALVNARTQQVAMIGDQVLAVRGPGFMAKACSVYVS